MTYTNDSYLTHIRGHSQGLMQGAGIGYRNGQQAGYDLGWNDANGQWVAKWNDLVVTHDKLLDIATAAREESRLQRVAMSAMDARTELLESSLKSAQANVESQKQTIERLQKQLSEARATEASQKQTIELHQEQALETRRENESLMRAFLGVVSIADPLLKNMAKMPFEQKSELRNQYGDKAAELLSEDYVDKGYPHSRTIIKQYLPIANQVFTAIAHESIARKAKAAEAEKRAAAIAAAAPVISPLAAAIAAKTSIETFSDDSPKVYIDGKLATPEELEALAV